MLRLRVARPEDAEGVHAIYSPYVARSSASFEEEVPSVGEIQQRIAHTLTKYPFFVCEHVCSAGEAFGIEMYSGREVSEAHQGLDEKSQPCEHHHPSQPVDACSSNCPGSSKPSLCPLEEDHHAMRCTIAGYAYASQHRTRSAYDWTAEMSVYIHPSYHRRGIGMALCSALISCLRRLGYNSVISGVTIPNEASLGLHRRLGFRLVGVYQRVGFKLGRWHDAAWLQCDLFQADEEGSRRGSKNDDIEHGKSRQEISKRRQEIELERVNDGLEERGDREQLGPSLEPSRVTLPRPLAPSRPRSFTSLEKTETDECTALGSVHLR